MADNFKFNDDFLRQVVHGPKMRGAMDLTATAVANEVERNAPSGFGGYRRRIETRTVRTAEGWKGRVEVRSSFWHLVEFGSINNPARAPLRRSLEVVLGLRNVLRR